MPDAFRWQLDFAPHLGFPTPDQPLFAELTGDVAPSSQIALAAAHGFRRIQDPFAAARSENVQTQVGDTARAAGLGVGCFVFAPLATAGQPLWSAVTDESRMLLADEMKRALAIGNRIGSKHIAVLTGSDSSRPHVAQMRAMAENLSAMGDRAAAAGMTLCVEAVDAARLPNMLLHHFADALAVVRDAAHPAVRVIFDTAHVQAMDGDILGNLDAGWNAVEIIQIADHPGRFEPGSGVIDFPLILDDIVQRGFTGPVELEHGWAIRGPAVQKNYLGWLKRWSNEYKG